MGSKPGTSRVLSHSSLTVLTTHSPEVHEVWVLRAVLKVVAAIMNNSYAASLKSPEAFLEFVWPSPMLFAVQFLYHSASRGTVGTEPGMNMPPRLPTSVLPHCSA